MIVHPSGEGFRRLRSSAKAPDIVSGDRLVIRLLCKFTLCVENTHIFNVFFVVKPYFDDMNFTYVNHFEGGLKLIRTPIKRTQFYQENSLEENEGYFDLIDKKYIHGVDNFYYTVYLENDSNENTNVDKLILDLLPLKDRLKQAKKKKELIEFQETGLCLINKNHKFYNLCLSDPDRYDIFFSEYLPNDVTGRIIVQIRSNALWVEGYTKVLLDSFNKLREIMDLYGLQIKATLENRNDLAFHTNILQNPEKELSDSYLNKHLFTTQEIYSKVGRIRRKSKNKLSVEYFSLGNRKSNSIFERFYNKTREVIEEGYKGYFFEIWYQNNLICNYDKFCYEFAYKKRNYDALHEARLRFYVAYGKNRSTRQAIIDLLNHPDTRLQDIESFANELMPLPTLIMNIEFETKRSFYRSADEQIDNLPGRMDVSLQLQRLFKVLDHRKLFLDYITDVTVSFRKCEDGEYMAWWKRLRSLKIDCNLIDEGLCRKYQTNLDKELVQRKIINAIASSAIYASRRKTTFMEDLSYLLAEINDNDMHNLSVIDLDTGAFVDRFDSEFLEQYEMKKEKKYRALKNRLPQDSPKSETE